jgi:hypothetical protein
LTKTAEWALRDFVQRIASLLLNLTVFVPMTFVESRLFHWQLLEVAARLSCPLPNRELAPPMGAYEGLTSVGGAID